MTVAETRHKLHMILVDNRDNVLDNYGPCTLADCMSTFLHDDDPDFVYDWAHYEAFSMIFFTATEKFLEAAVHFDDIVLADMIRNCMTLDEINQAARLYDDLKRRNPA